VVALVAALLIGGKPVYYLFKNKLRIRKTAIP